MNILVSGASGLIGSALIPELEAAGHTVRRLVRREPVSALEVPWQTNQIDPTAIQSFDAIVHLAGRNIGARWTASVKQEIHESRVQGTRSVATAAAEAFRTGGKPALLISVSAIGYYGSRGNEELSETSGSGSGFLAETCRDWEAAAEPAAAAGIRVAVPRVGVVLTKSGGALKKMLPPFQLGLGGPIGSGRQWMSWIVLEDLVRVLTAALDDPRMRGPVNAVAPQPVTNLEFTRTLGSTLHRPTIFPVPAFVVKALFGEMGDETLLASGRVLPRKLEELGFNFRHPQIVEALRFATQN